MMHATHGIRELWDRPFRRTCADVTAVSMPQPGAGRLALTAACYFNFATATAIAAARLIPLPCAQLSRRSSTAGSIVTVITLFFPVRLIDFLPSGA
jgi:hypothetical protein